MSETICRKCDTPIYGQHKGFDTKPPSFEHLKCPTCPDCGHGFTYHANGKCITALSSIGQGCPCTRTYESLVGEKGSKTAKELGIECVLIGIGPPQNVPPQIRPRYFVISIGRQNGQQPFRDIFGRTVRRKCHRVHQEFVIR